LQHVAAIQPDVHGPCLSRSVAITVQMCRDHSVARHITLRVPLFRAATHESWGS